MAPEVPEQPEDPTKGQPSFERLRILWSFARPYRGRLGLGLALSLLGSAGALATPMVTKWVLDTIGTDQSMLAPIGALLGLLVLGALIWLCQWIILGTLGEQIVLDARESMIRRFLRAKIPALGRRSPGEMVTRVTSDTLLLREATSSSVIGIINGFVMVIGTLVLMAVLDVVLLATTAASIVLVTIIFLLLMPAIARAQERAQEHVGRLGGVLEGALRAIRTVKASRAEERQGESISGDARESMRFSVVAIRREAIAWTVAFTGIQLAIIAILGIGAWRVDEGVLEVSSLVAFMLYAFGLMEPVMSASQNITSLQAGIAAAGRIREVEALEIEEGARDDAGEPGTLDEDGAAGRPVLEFDGVVARYAPDGEPAVRSVSFGIPRHGHVAIVGPSGAGKTTLFSLMLRFLEPVEGELRLDGHPYSGYSPFEVREAFAYVEQETPLVPGTVRDNLLLADPGATDAELAEAIEAVRLTDRLAGLPEGLDSPVSSSTLSGGERQRIALARAILRSPRVLLLDEATAQLDGLTEVAIQESIHRHAQRGAVVTIAHRLSTVIDADLILVMEHGRIRARGSHRELMDTDELYRELVEALRIATGPADPDGRLAAQA